MDPSKRLRNSNRDSDSGNLNNRAAMGAAFIVEHNKHLFTRAKIDNWPTSTRAELAAIFLALLTVPEKAKVSIHTDNLSAIQSIQNSRNKSSKQWLKTTNMLWVLHIDTIIREKNLEFLLK